MATQGGFRWVTDVWVNRISTETRNNKKLDTTKNLLFLLFVVTLICENRI